MADEIDPERIRIIAEAACVPLDAASPARIARAVAPTAWASRRQGPSSRLRPNRRHSPSCSKGSWTVERSRDAQPDRTCRRDPRAQTILRRGHDRATRAHSRLAAENQCLRQRRGGECAGSWRERPTRRLRAARSRGRCTACRSPTRICIIRPARSRGAGRNCGRAGSPRRHRRRLRGLRRPDHSASARCIWRNSPTVRRGTTPISAMPAIRGTPNTSPAAHPPARVRPWRQGSCRRRSARIPAARSACRRIFAASPASSRPMDASAAPTPCRCPSPSTRSARWRAPPRIAR